MSTLISGKTINAGRGLRSREDPMMGNVLEVNHKYMMKMFTKFMSLLENPEELALYLTSDNTEEREMAQLIVEYKRSRDAKST